MRRKCTRRLKLSLSVTLLVLVVFYVEVFTYYGQSGQWLRPECRDAKSCTRILLVADPQIIGNYREVLHFLTPISIFDSDMYLRKTYYHAYNFAQPDIVVFLGDLMDEGSTAEDRDFYEYVRRIFDIFLDKAASSVKHIWLPGDNDVGGEGNDLVTNHKLKRFYRAFAQPELITHRNITFFKVNRLIQSLPVFKENREFYDTSRIFVGLSHIPLMFMPSPFVEKVLSKMLPHVLFTAHEHKSMIVSTDALLRGDRQIVPVTPDNNMVFQYTLGVSDMYEFIVPTCSYRMGTDKIGFGFAVLEKNELRYTVLWSPSRFHQLGSYLTCIALLILCNLLIYCCCCRSAIKRF